VLAARFETVPEPVTLSEAAEHVTEADTVQAFHDRLGEHCDSPMSSQIIRTDDEVAGLVEAVGDADLAIVGTVVRSRFRNLLFPDRFSRTGRRNCWTHVPATCCWCGLSSLVKTRRSAASSSDMYSDSTLHVRSFNVREHVRPVS